MERGKHPPSPIQAIGQAFRRYPIQAPVVRTSNIGVCVCAACFAVAVGLSRASAASRKSPHAMRRYHFAEMMTALASGRHQLQAFWSAFYLMFNLLRLLEVSRGASFPVQKENSGVINVASPGAKRHLRAH